MEMKNCIVNIVGVIIVLFVIYCMVSEIGNNIQSSSNKTSLEKYYDTHPNAYFKDMKEQEQIQNLKQNIQDKIDEQKLYN